MRVQVGICGYMFGLDMWVHVGTCGYKCASIGTCGIDMGTNGHMWNVGTCVANCRNVGTCDDVSGYL